MAGLVVSAADVAGLFRSATASAFRILLLLAQLLHEYDIAGHLLSEQVPHEKHPFRDSTLDLPNSKLAVDL